MRMTSGRASAAIRVASWPLFASATTVRSAKAPRTYFRPLATIGWSSTIMTRIGPRLFAAIHSSPSGQRPGDADLGPAARLGNQVILSANGLRALADDLQPEMPGRSRRGVKAAAIILDRK